MRAQHKNILRHLRRQIRNTNLTHGQKLRFYKCGERRGVKDKKYGERGGLPKSLKAGTTIYKR